MALIHQKTAPLFYDSLNPASVWLFAAISRRKITANSTYWKEMNPKNSLQALFDYLQKITL